MSRDSNKVMMPKSIGLSMLDVAHLDSDNIAAMTNGQIADIYCSIAVNPDIMSVMSASCWLALEYEIEKRDPMNNSYKLVDLGLDKIPESTIFTSKQIRTIEDYYSAIFLGDFSKMVSGTNWTREPIAVFWKAEREKPEYSHYFGIYFEGWNDNKLMITNAADCFAEPIDGYGMKDNPDGIYCSKFTHDFVEVSKSPMLAIDGGRSYRRIVGDASFNEYYIFPNGPSFYALEKKGIKQ